MNDRDTAEVTLTVIDSDPREAPLIEQFTFGRIKIMLGDDDWLTLYVDRQAQQLMISDSTGGVLHIAPRASNVVGVEFPRDPFVREDVVLGMFTVKTELDRSTWSYRRTTSAVGVKSNSTISRSREMAIQLHQEEVERLQALGVYPE